MEDGQLVAVVLGEPDLRIVELQLESVWGSGCVAARLVPLRSTVTEEHEPAGLVRRFPLGVRDEVRAHVLRDHHQTVRSIAVSTSSAFQKSAET
jgi:hypothetical protein